MFIIPDVNSYSPGLSLKWEYNLGGVPKEAYTEDLYDDGSDEFIFVLSTGVYAIDNNGHLLWGYDLDNIQAVSIADVNDDQYKEIVISSGAMAEGIARGWITVLDRNGHVLRKFPSSKVGSTTLMRDITAVDIDNNKYYEVVGGSMFEVSAIKDTYDGFLWHKIINDTIEHLEVTDLVSGTRRIVANSFSSVYLLDLNGALLWSYNIHGGIKAMRIANIYGDGGKDILIISGENKVYVIDSDGKLEFETSMERNINAVGTSYLNSTYEKTIIGSGGMVYAMNPKFQMDWKYDVGEEITGIYNVNHDRNGKNGILVTAGNGIYEIDENGNFVWLYAVDNNINKLIPVGMNDDNYDEFVVVSGSRISAFNINITYINKQEADSYYASAYAYFNSGDYKNSSTYVEKAILLYSSIGDMEGIIKSRLLSLNTSTDVKTDKIKLADIYYRSAENYYYESDYANARRHAEKAIEIYREINEGNGISKSRALLLRIEDMVGGIEGSTTTMTTLAETPNEEPKQDYAKLALFAMEALLVIILIVLILRIKK